MEKSRSRVLLALPNYFELIGIEVRQKSVENITRLDAVRALCLRKNNKSCAL